MKSKLQDIGIIAIKLLNDPNTINILNLAKNISIHRPYNQVCVFNSYYETINNHEVPVLHLNQSKFFYGDLILIDIDGLELSSSFPNISKRYLYIDNIPWLSKIEKYSYWEKLFLSDNLNIIVNNQQLYDVFDICFKKPIGIAEEFTYDKIQDFI